MTNSKPWKKVEKAFVQIAYNTASADDAVHFCVHNREYDFHHTVNLDKINT